jgi:hypothetical protein
MSQPGASLNDFLRRALVMGEAERAALAHELLLSIEEPEASDDASREWEATLQARLDAAERGEFAEGDWRDSLARIRESLKRDEPMP